MCMQKLHTNESARTQIKFKCERACIIGGVEKEKESVLFLNHLVIIHTEKMRVFAWKLIHAPDATPVIGRNIKFSDRWISMH